MGALLCSLLPLLAAAASEHSAAVQGGVSTVGALVGAGLLLLFAAAAAVPVAQRAAHAKPPSVAPDEPSSGARNESTPQDDAHLSAHERPAHEEELAESEQRLLRAMGYNEMQIAAGAEDDDAEGGLTEAEIAAFRLKTRRLSGDSTDSPPARFRDRMKAEQPLSEIMKAWQVQQNSPGGSSQGAKGTPADMADGELSPALQKRSGAKANSNQKQGGGTAKRGGAAGLRAEAAKQRKARGGVGKQGIVPGCGSPLAAGA